MSRALGAEGERQAARFLKKQGYKIVTQNFRVRGGEVDIIARDGRTLVFVEVKARHGHRFGEPHWAVDLKKRRHLTLAAMVYMIRERIGEKACRFDLVLIETDAGTKESRFELIKNAFDAEIQGCGGRGGP